MGDDAPSWPEIEREALELLEHGRLDVQGRRGGVERDPLCRSGRRVAATCVYKPIAGERPLWDFPDGTLAGREVAAFVVSEATGWDLVPPTILRDGPFGPGMCQFWIDVDPTSTSAHRRSDHAELRGMAFLTR